MLIILSFRSIKISVNCYNSYSNTRFVSAMAFATFQDGVLRKIFAVALKPSHVDANASPPVVHLADLEQASCINFPPLTIPIYCTILKISSDDHASSSKNATGT